MEKAYGRWAVLEERIWVIEASSLYYPMKTTKICLVPNVVVPKYFWVLEFIKYMGTQCPLTHIKAYYNKMVEVFHDKKLLVHFFEDNFSDITLT